MTDARTFGCEQRTSSSFTCTRGIQTSSPPNRALHVGDGQATFCSVVRSSVQGLTEMRVQLDAVLPRIFADSPSDRSHGEG